MEVAIYTAVTIGVSALSLYLSNKAAKKNQPKLKDDNPTTTASRGDYLPFGFGRELCGATVLGVGKRNTRKEKLRGKKGKADQEQKVFYEQAVHALSWPGPLAALWRITQNGNVIFDGPITPGSHPSGSRVELGKEGSFLIYWGEPDQPFDDEFEEIIKKAREDIDDQGIRSRWPYLPKLVWDKKRLGVTAQWGDLIYEIEREVTMSQLTRSPSFFEASFRDTGGPVEVFDATNGAVGIAKFRLYFGVDGEGAEQRYRPLDRVKITNNTGLGPDFEAEILTSKLITVSVVLDDVVQTEYYVDVFINTTLSGATDDGQLFLRRKISDDGYNPAHMIDEMLFAPFPHGMGASRDEVDIESLEDFGEICRNEKILGSFIETDGEELVAIIGKILQDCGFMLPIDVETGLLRFMPIRNVESSALPVIPQDAISDPLPEVMGTHFPLSATKVIFSFSNRDNRYKRDTIGGYNDDGSFAFYQHRRAKTIDLFLPHDFNTAARMGERRQLEELSDGAVFKLHSNRGLRALIPGRQFLIEGDSRRFICQTNNAPADKARVVIEATEDWMGAPLSAYAQTPTGGGQGEVPTPIPDLAYTIIEVPDQLLNEQNRQEIIVPHIRGHDQISAADIWLSEDDIAYVLEGFDDGPITGGQLLVDYANEESGAVEIGPTFTAIGVDLTSVAIDLSADPAAWRRGEQVVSIGNELFFLRNIEPLGNDVWRMRGLIPARYATQRQAHTAGTAFFIFSFASMETFTSTILAPNKKVYVKPQARTVGESVPLDQIAPASKTLEGRGLKPMEPSNLVISSPRLCVPEYDDGQDMTIQWTYRSPSLPGTGAGDQGYGVAGSSIAPIDGSFILEIRNTGGSLIRQEEIVDGREFIYTGAQRTADFGIDPSAFDITLTAAKGGLFSSSLTLRVNKV